MYERCRGKVYRCSGKVYRFSCRKPVLLWKETNNISNAINPCSNNRLGGIKQKQLEFLKFFKYHVLKEGQRIRPCGRTVLGNNLCFVPIIVGDMVKLWAGPRLSFAIPSWSPSKSWMSSQWQSSHFDCNLHTQIATCTVKFQTVSLLLRGRFCSLLWRQQSLISLLLLPVFFGQSQCFHTTGVCPWYFISQLPNLLTTASSSDLTCYSQYLTLRLFNSRSLTFRLGSWPGSLSAFLFLPIHCLNLKNYQVTLSLSCWFIFLPISFSCNVTLTRLGCSTASFKFLICI